MVTCNEGNREPALTGQPEEPAAPAHLRGPPLVVTTSWAGHYQLFSSSAIFSPRFCEFWANSWRVLPKSSKGINHLLLLCTLLFFRELGIFSEKHDYWLLLVTADGQKKLNQRSGNQSPRFALKRDVSKFQVKKLKKCRENPRLCVFSPW